MCIRQIVQPNRATVGNISASKVPPETSLIMSAPAPMHADATDAR